tara:strand:+ start:180 stop:350 length:171 start_codon:yes stop_codon:yes gene_type:complete
MVPPAIAAVVITGDHRATAGFAVAVPSADVALPRTQQAVASHPVLNEELVREQVLW